MSEILSESLSGGYGIVPRSIMQDGSLSISAKGLLAYFLSFTGAGKNVCYPSYDTMQKQLGVSRATLSKLIKELEDSGHIGKTQGKSKNGIFNIYHTLFECTTGQKYKITTMEQEVVQNLNRGSSKSELGVVQNLNSNINNIILTKNSKRTSSIPGVVDDLEENQLESKTNDKQTNKTNSPKKEVLKKKYGEYVSLTAKQYETLLQRYRDGAAEMITKLNSYQEWRIENFGGIKKYKSDYRALIGWVADWWEEEKLKREKDSKPIYEEYKGGGEVKGWEL